MIWRVLRNIQRLRFLPKPLDCEVPPDSLEVTSQIGTVRGGFYRKSIALVVLACLHPEPLKGVSGDLLAVISKGKLPNRRVTRSDAFI
jgi:hypothetical protein